MSDFDSLFDDAMRDADAAIMARMSSSFTLQLKGGGELPLRAIYDTELSLSPGKANNATPRVIDASFEHGALTVLGQRIDRELVSGAIVQTPQGEKVVGSVFYQDRTTTVMVLTVPGGTQLPAGNSNRWMK